MGRVPGEGLGPKERQPGGSVRERLAWLHSDRVQVIWA